MEIDRYFGILFKIINCVSNGYLNMASVSNVISLSKELKENKEYITLSHEDLISMFLLLLHSMLSVQDINSVFLRGSNTLTVALGLDTETTTYYTVGYYQDLSLEEKQNIIKYFMCLLIDIEF